MNECQNKGVTAKHTFKSNSTKSIYQILRCSFSDFVMSVYVGGNCVCCFAFFRFVLEIEFLFTFISVFSASDFAIYSFIEKLEKAVEIQNFPYPTVRINLGEYGINREKHRLT